MKQMVTTPINPSAVFAALETWIKQRPGLDPADYGCHAGQLLYSSKEQIKIALSAYRSDIRSIGKDRKRAMKALDEARNLEPKAELLAEAFGAFSGRLEWDGARLSCTTAQYWPTEYRKAAASVLERYIALWKQDDAEKNPRSFAYRTMADVEAANRSIGNCWFDRCTMKFFKTRIESGLIAGHRFISSERGPDDVRRYSVREACPNGTIGTVGEFQQYRTRDQARAAVLAG